jgi:uncharacterized protein YecE (DUF72 family)
MAVVVKVGISAWTEKTLIDSGWYPPEARDAEGRLRYYASRYPLVEVDMPYYALPTPETAVLWRDRTPPSFTFDVKAFALFTGHHTDPRRLPKDLRATLPEEVTSKTRLYPKDVDQGLLDELARRFREALEPLREGGKLGFVLLQYPAWFPISRTNKQQIVRARELFPDWRLAIEFRNRTWMSDKNQEETLQFLRGEGLIYTCVDEPQGFVSSIPPVVAATARAGLVRMHGRNADTWQRSTRTAAERFDHRYSPDELREWVPKIQRLADETAEVHVVMNNCHRDYAVDNATELAEMLEGAGVPTEVPSTVPGVSPAAPARAERRRSPPASAR